MAGSSIAESDGGDDSLYGPEPTSGIATPESQDHDLQNTETKNIELPDSGHQDPLPQESDSKDSNTGEAEPRNPDKEDNDPQDPESKGPDPEELEPQNSETKDVQLQEPDIQDPSPQDPALRNSDPELLDDQSPDSQSPDPQASKARSCSPAPNSKASSPRISDLGSPKSTTAGPVAMVAAIFAESSESSSPSPASTLASLSLHSHKDPEQRKKEREARKRDKKRKVAESLRIQNEAIQRLREQLKYGRLAICVGSGVTLYSAPSQTQRLSWWGLMSNALDYFEDQASGLTTQPINKADLATAREILKKNNPTEADREGVTNRIQKLLASRVDLETTWIRAQFQNLYKDHVDQVEILDAIKLLQQQGALLFTTNYDDLLESHCDLDSIDASDPKALLSYRRGSRPGVFHPHGFWKNPKHIVLSAEQYWGVKNDKVVQETLQHILDTKTVLFVGCGGGLSDPNFGSLINWVGERNVGTSASHYILLQRSEQNPVTQLPLIHLRCESFDDIPRFLKDLLDPSERREGNLAELPWDRERMRIHKWLEPINQSGFLNDILNLQGPNRFDRQVTLSEDVWSMNTPSRIRVRGEQGFGKTMFCASVIHHTLRNCRLGAWKRNRDSLAYFFCTTYDPHIEVPKIQRYDLNLFLRTVISQLCPPENVFDSLRTLYTECTRHHPARLPTNDELQAVFIEIIKDLDKPPAPKHGDPVTPGETYLIIDELETLPGNLKNPYSRFIKAITSLSLEHFHILVAAESPLTVGVDPPARLKKTLKGKRSRRGQKVIKASQTPKSSASNWVEVAVNWETTGTARMEWLRDHFTNDPTLAYYANIREDIMSEIHASAQNFRWVYWRLNLLGQVIGAETMSDDDLGQIAIGVLEDGSEHNDDEGSDYAVDDASGDTEVLPGGKRSKKDSKLGGNKKRQKM
ncbi:SIR2-like domain-containing protein [Xylaria sp. FL1777]|nr:SIR2-like domain-containing protein [Xylaria sp. FL1777]